MMAGGEGLNLVGGNHVFMLDLHWNPAVELQATDRAHRVGQTRNVHVHRSVTGKFMCKFPADCKSGRHCLISRSTELSVVCVRFVCKGTVEERIQILQTKKLQLSASVLSGLASNPLKDLPSIDHSFLLLFLLLQCFQTKAWQQTDTPGSQGSLPSSMTSAAGQQLSTSHMICDLSQ